MATVVTYSAIDHVAMGLDVTIDQEAAMDQGILNVITNSAELRCWLFFVNILLCHLKTLNIAQNKYVFYKTNASSKTRSTCKSIIF
jgi:hypothetical protein